MPERSNAMRLTIDIEPNRTFITLDDTPVFDSSYPDSPSDFPEDSITGAPSSEFIGD